MPVGTILRVDLGLMLEVVGPSGLSVKMAAGGMHVDMAQLSLADNLMSLFGTIICLTAAGRGSKEHARGCKHRHTRRAECSP